MSPKEACYFLCELKEFHDILYRKSNFGLTLLLIWAEYEVLAVHLKEFLRSQWPLHLYLYLSYFSLSSSPTMA